MKRWHRNTEEKLKVANSIVVGCKHCFPNYKAAPQNKRCLAAHQFMYSWAHNKIQPTTRINLYISAINSLNSPQPRLCNTDTSRPNSHCSFIPSYLFSLQTILYLKGGRQTHTRTRLRSGPHALKSSYPS